MYPFSNDKDRRKKDPFDFFGFDDEFERMFRNMEKMWEHAFKDFNFDQIEPGRSFVHGFNIRIGPDGKPKIREFGNVKPSTDQETCGINQPCLNVKQEREPLVDIIDLEKEIRVIVEIPGVEKEAIKLSGTEEILTISVNTSERKYFKEIMTPTKINPKKAKSSYKNGVLEVTLPKIQEKKKATGENINIE